MEYDPASGKLDVVAMEDKHVDTGGGLVVLITARIAG
jgi:hypothetical protein